MCGAKEKPESDLGRAPAIEAKLLVDCLPLNVGCIPTSQAFTRFRARAPPARKPMPALISSLKDNVPTFAILIARALSGS